MKACLAIVLTLMGFVCIALVAASGGDDDPATIVVIVRHAEKGESTSSPSDPRLSPAGQSRAEELAHVLKDAGVTAIYVTPFARARETARPLASQTGITPNSIAPDDIDSLVTQIQSQHAGKTVLVVGHSNTVPQIVARLSGQSVPEIAEAEFDNLYVITKRQSGATVLRLRYGKAN